MKQKVFKDVERNRFTFDPVQPHNEGPIKLDKVYTRVEMEVDIDHFGIKDPYKLNHGDVVYMFVTRQDYHRTNNKNHGWVIVRANVVFDGWEKSLHLWEEDVERWKKPIGKEVLEQWVGHIHWLPPYKHVMHKIGVWHSVEKRR